MSYDNLLIVLAAAAAVPVLPGLFTRLPIPGPVPAVIAGVALGPAVLNAVHADAAVQACQRLVGDSCCSWLDWKSISSIFGGERAKLASLCLGVTLVLAALVGELLSAAPAAAALCVGTRGQAAWR